MEWFTSCLLREGEFTMSTPTTEFLPENQLIQKAIKALMDVLGPVEASRFLALSREKRLESVLQHREWQETLDKDAFFDQVFPEK